MIAHETHHVSDRHFLIWFDPEWIRLGTFNAVNIVSGQVERRCRPAKHAPHPGFAVPEGSEIQGGIRVGETEISVFSIIVSRLAGERDDILGIETVVRVIQGKLAYSRLVGV